MVQIPGVRNLLRLNAWLLNAVPRRDSIFRCEVFIGLKLQIVLFAVPKVNSSATWPAKDGTSMKADFATAFSL